MKHLTCFLILFALIACKKDPMQAQRVNSGTVQVNTSTWMQQFLLMYPTEKVTLKNIFIPAAHDAGMYQLTSCTFGANDCNTQTQHQSFYKMLEQGIRFFDVRPKKKGNKYYTFHATDCDGLGCTGALLSEIYRDINLFLETHRELVVLELSHFCHTSVADTALINMAQRTFGDKLYKDTLFISDFVNQPLSSLLTSNYSGKIMLIYEGISNTIQHRSVGQFSPDILPKEGRWTNSQTLTDLNNKQTVLYQNYTNAAGILFQFNWQITLDAAGSISCAINPFAQSIEKKAGYANSKFLNLADSLISSGEIRKGRIPNIIYFDYCDSTISKKCIQISRFNLE